MMGFSALALLIGFFLQRNLGRFDDWTAVYALAYFACIAWASRRFREGIGVIVLCVVLGFVLWTRSNPHLLYSRPVLAGGALAALLDLRVKLACGLLVTYFLARRLFVPLSAAFAVATLAALAFVPLVSPFPAIDVFTSNTAAVDYFLGGKNPYNQTYVDIYNGAYGYEAAFFYLPGLLLGLVPFRALFGDIRFAFVAAHLAIALGLWYLCRRSTAHIRWLAPLLWLAFPVNFFVLEQAWVDTALLCFLVWAWVFRIQRRWILTAVFSGLAISIKQYGFIFPLLVFVDLWKSESRKRAFEYLGIVACVAGAICLPFFLSAPAGFIKMTVTNLASQAFRPDSLSITAWIYHRWGWLIPSWLQVAVITAAIAAGVRWVYRSQAVIEASLLAYGAFFFFAKLSFCNYHTLLAGFAVLGLANALR